jgi:hypothetical protein
MLSPIGGLVAVGSKRKLSDDNDVDEEPPEYSSSSSSTKKKQKQTGTDKGEGKKGGKLITCHI